MSHQQISQFYFFLKFLCISDLELYEKCNDVHFFKRVLILKIQKVIQELLLRRAMQPKGYISAQNFEALTKTKQSEMLLHVIELCFFKEKNIFVFYLIKCHQDLIIFRKKLQRLFLMILYAWTIALSILYNTFRYILSYTKMS